jgi:hypothetical protein
LGNFYLTSIVSLRKGNKRNYPFPAAAGKQITVHDYDFVRDRYFFIDMYYKDYFEEGFRMICSGFISIKINQGI